MNPKEKPSIEIILGPEAKQYSEEKQNKAKQFAIQEQFKAMTAAVTGNTKHPQN